MKIYNYHQTTGEFLSEGFADLDPNSPDGEDVWLIPGYATSIVPPEHGIRQCAVFDGDAWLVRVDWRGAQLFSTTDAKPVAINAIGLSPHDVGATDKVRPNAAYEWDGSNWVYSQEKADAMVRQERSDAWEKIKAKREDVKKGGVLVSGKWFHSDADSRIQQLGLVMMGSSVPPVQWKTMDGTFIAMTQTLAMQIFTATATHDIAAFSAAEAHKAAMEQVPATQYDYSGGWPAIYQG